MKRHLKDSLIIRGCFFLFKDYFGDLKRRKYSYIADNAVLTPPLFVGNPKNVYLNEGVGIGPGAYLSATNAKIIFKDDCAVAENLTIHTGNHARVIGRFVSAITEKDKPKGYDHDVIIERDVWIGCNVTILSGVHIGRGVTLAAGAVVNKDIPPYCIAGGCPARPIKFYWTVDQIIEHEKILYPKEERMSRLEL